MIVSTAQAAEQLGVTRRRVSELVRSGALEAVELSGRYVIDAAALGRFAFTTRLNGRPWDQDLSWEILRALSGEDIQLSERAQNRIESNSVVDIAGQINRLLVIRRFQAQGLIQSEHFLAKTGESAVERLGVQLAGSSQELHAFSLVDNPELAFDAVPYSDGNLVLYAWRDTEIRVSDTTPLALVAVNCMLSENSRVREAGKVSLEELRKSWLAKHSK
ncbi:MAG: helix-turn-helix domain-containing protein [Actinomycetota bacterium]